MNMNVEALGLGRGDIPANVLAPPPLFPQLVNRPLQIQQGVKERRLLQLQSNIVNNFRASQQQVYQNIDWSYLPKELKVGVKKRKKEVKPNITKTKADLKNIEARLANLEEKERVEGSGDEEESTEKKPADSDDEEKKEDAEELEEDEDEEMDSGTDYANNYFDGGDDYEDDDEKQDDEGVF